MSLRAVALSPNKFVLTREGTELTVFGAHGKKSRRVASTVAEEKPGLWYAISPRGDVAETFDDEVRVLGRWEQGAGAMWGPPRFSPDGSWLATLHAGGAALWDARTGKSVWSITSDRLTLVRAIDFAPDGRHAVLRCSSNRPGPANHTAFVVRLGSPSDPVALPWHDRELIGVMFVDSNHVATLDEGGTVRLYAVCGDLEAELALPAPAAAFSTAGALERVIAAGHHGEVWIWERAREGLVTLRGVGPTPFAVGFTTAGEPWAVEPTGQSTMLPSSGPSTGLRERRFDGAPEVMKARTALWSLEEQQFDIAVDALAAFEHDPRDMKLTLAFHYATLRDDDMTADFGAYLRAQGVPTGDARVAAALLSLAGEFGNVSAVALALDFFMTWFRVRRDAPALAADDERAILVGRRLASDMAETGDEDMASRLLDMMSGQWPDRVSR